MGARAAYIYIRGEFYAEGTNMNLAIQEVVSGTCTTRTHIIDFRPSGLIIFYKFDGLQNLYEVSMEQCKYVFSSSRNLIMSLRI